MIAVEINQSLVLTGLSIVWIGFAKNLRVIKGNSSDLYLTVWSCSNVWVFIAPFSWHRAFSKPLINGFLALCKWVCNFKNMWPLKKYGVFKVRQGRVLRSADRLRQIKRDKDKWTALLWLCLYFCEEQCKH